MRADASPGLHADPSADQAWRELHARSCAPYRAAGRFAWHFARGKLGRDPVFRGLVERGELRCGDGPPRVVDIGCGQGLLASLLQQLADAQPGGKSITAEDIASKTRAAGDHIGVTAFGSGNFGLLSVQQQIGHVRFGGGIDDRDIHLVMHDIHNPGH